MENLAMFIEVILPASLCIMAIVFGLLAITGQYVVQARWDREDRICDELDEFYYDVKHCNDSIVKDDCFMDCSGIAKVIVSDNYLKDMLKFSKYTAVSFEKTMEKGHVYN